MIKKYSIFLSLLSVIFGQISMSDINSLSNNQLDVIKQELQAQAVSQDNDNTDIEAVETIPSVVNIESTTPSSSSEYFGYDYFRRDINFFDNIPTPPDFKLGPGDEIILSLWGETNSRENFVINKEGLIYYENIGFINLSNKNLKEAELILVEELSRIYSTLKDKENQTELMLELGKLKSINVYFSGQIETPGIHLIHPFSDIFSAIVQAGGVKQEGSLRQVQLIRNNKVISTVDFYSFFINGKNNFSSAKIIDGDVIHIPIVSKRVRIQGAITNPGFFELFDDESLADLIQYAGNLGADASSNIILDVLVPLSERLSDDNARLSITTNIKTASNTKLNNGDTASVRFIGDVVTQVEVFGRIKFPGLYSPSTLKEVLDIAGGFNDPLYRKSIRDDEIFILRKDENQFYGLEFETSYNESDKFELIAGDKIFVYEDYRYNNNFTITVGGEVKKKGSFPLTSEMTVGQAIDLAEGLTPIGNPKAITVFQDFVQSNNDGEIVTTSKKISNVTLDLVLNANASIVILPYKDMVNIEGNVYSPGLVAYQQGLSVNNYIKLAGGHQENSLKNRIYLQRANGEIENVARGGRFKKPEAGDTIVVPVEKDPQDFDTASFVADILSVLTNLVAILAIVDNNSNNN
jgi:protein involved in polysaccharide export with SLBB domain